MDKKLDFVSLKKGDFLSETQYYIVTDVVDFGLQSVVKVKNERGFEFSIGRNIIEEGSYSASQFSEIKEVTRTDLIEVFRQVGDTVFTVCFNKQPAAEDINKAIESTNKGKILPMKDMKKIIKEAFKGEERILTGYLIKTETGFGRSMVIDLALERGDNPEWDARIRQVDHRTLNWLIHKNIKYVVKNK